MIRLSENKRKEYLDIVIQEITMFSDELILQIKQAFEDYFNTDDDKLKMYIKGYIYQFLQSKCNYDIHDMYDEEMELFYPDVKLHIDNWNKITLYTMLLFLDIDIVFSEDGKFFYTNVNE